MVNGTLDFPHFNRHASITLQQEKTDAEDDYGEEELAGNPEFMIAVIEAGSASEIYPDSEANFVYVPERVMERILGVAKAYQLKFPEHASRDLSVRWVYRYIQVEWMIDELEFLQSLLNDQLLNGYISKILALASKVLSKPHKLELAFEGP